MGVPALANGVFPEEPRILSHVVLASLLGVVIGVLSAFSTLRSPSGLELPAIVAASFIMSLITYFIMVRLSERHGIGLIIEVFLVILVSSLATWIVTFDIFR